MQTRRNIIVNQPALIPIAGIHDKKPRILDRDVTTIGRARGSDLCMEANEISTLHCVIFRTADGHRIRDCNSRCGTRVNGESVRNALLHDGDIVNLGPFSFEFRLPPALFPNEGGRVDPLKVVHWKESRRRLAQLALKLRNRLHSDSAASPQEQEWTQKANLLKEKIRCYDQRLGELEGAEEELAEERRQLAAESEQERQRVQKIEKELAERLAHADEEIHERWQEFQKRCQAEEARSGAPAPARSFSPKETLHDGAAQRQKDADGKKNQRLQELQEQLDRRHDQWQREQQEFNNMKEQWVQDQARASATVEQQMVSLDRQKAELLRMMGDLKQMQADLRKQAKPDVRALQDEIERLQRENAELRSRPDASDAPGNDETRQRLDDLHAEVELLHEELRKKEQALEELQHGSAPADGAVEAENAVLKQLLEDKNRLIEELSGQPQQAPRTEGDLEHYEAELNEFRRQLEADRSKLNKEVETLRDRNQELDEAIREMEMEMSKERAELARERMKLERVREEVKADSERLQRELAVRDSMAPVQKLREGLNGKQPPAKSDKPLNDRLRGIRNQLSDTPTPSS